MIDWNKFLGRCGIALLFVSLCAIGFEFHLVTIYQFTEIFKVVDFK